MGLKHSRQLNITPILFFQFCAYLRMEFGDIEALGSYKFKRKNSSRKDSYIEIIRKFDFK